MYNALHLLCTLCSVSATAAMLATAAGSASTFAGSTVSAVFPPPGATDTSLETYFPDASQVGHAGPTPSASALSLSLASANYLPPF